MRCYNYTYYKSLQGHELTRFKNEKEFFLIHISNIPDEAIWDFNRIMKIESTDINLIRQIHEDRMMTQELIGDEWTVE